MIPTMKYIYFQRWVNLFPSNSIILQPRLCDENLSFQNFRIWQANMLLWNNVYSALVKDDSLFKIF